MSCAAAAAVCARPPSGQRDGPPMGRHRARRPARAVVLVCVQSVLSRQTTHVTASVPKVTSRNFAFGRAGRRGTRARPRRPFRCAVLRLTLTVRIYPAATRPLHSWSLHSRQRPSRRRCSPAQLVVHDVCELRRARAVELYDLTIVWLEASLQVGNVHVENIPHARGRTRAFLPHPAARSRLNIAPPAAR